MANADKTIRLFASATQPDLTAPGPAAGSGIRRMGWKTDMMEGFHASPHATESACRRRIGGGDLPPAFRAQGAEVGAR